MSTTGREGCLVEEIPAAVWCPRVPTLDDVRRARLPVFLATPVRPQWRLALARALLHPTLAARWVGRRRSVRDLLAFVLWLDTKACFGVRAVELPDGSSVPAVRPRRREGREPDARVGVLVIAQDEEATLGHALESVVSFASQIVVVDGGSRDDTAGVARRFGADVLSRPFDRDFSAQRNAGLERLRTPWVVSVDADEVVEPDLARLLPEVARSACADAVLVPRLNLVDEEPEPDPWVEMQLRLFRGHLRFRGRVHERLMGWKRAVQTPISGPYLLHRKTLLRKLRAALLYSTIDPSPYSPELLAWMRSEVARLEAEAEGGRP